MEHRWGSRKKIDVPVRFVALPTRIGTGRITNISMTGAFIETDEQLRPTAVLYVEMIHRSQEPGPSRRLSAIVVRKTAAGVGIEWCEAASKSPLYARLHSSAGDAPGETVDDVSRTNAFLYQFEFVV